MTLKSLGGSLVMVLVVGLAPSANAAAVVGQMEDRFDYAVQTIPNASSLNGGRGFNANGNVDANAATANWGIAGAILNAGSNRSITSPGLNATAVGYFPAFGNKLTLDAAAANATQNIGRLLGDQVIDSGTTYFSLQMSRNNETIRTINWAFFGGTTTTAAGTERFAVGMIGAAAGNLNGNIGLLMNNSNPAGLIAAASPIAMGTGVTHLIVGKIEWNAGGFETVSIWVDPANVTNEAAAGAVYASTSAFELTSINAVRPFVGNTAAGFNAVSANFDEFRLGGTWASVTTTSLYPKPGDVNGDTFINLADFAIIRDNFQKTVASRSLGDLNEDGRVNFLDYREWKTVSGLAVPNLGSVPEPASAVLGLLAVAALGGMRRRLNAA